MTVRTEWVPYGPGAGRRLRQEVTAAKAAGPLSPVTVIVASNHVGVSTRRQLASGRLGPVSAHGSGVAAVDVLTVYRLAELLGAQRLAGSGRRPVSAAVIAAAIRQVLADRPGLFGPVASHPSTEEALVSSYQELRDLSGAALHAVAGVGRRAAEVVRVHRETRARLEPAWYDEEDLMEAAADIIAASPERAGLGHVVAYLPQRLTRHGAALLRAVAVHHDVVVLAGTTGDSEADADVVRAVHDLDAVAPEPPGAAGPVVDATRSRFVTTSDADEEVRHAVRAVMDAVMGGTPLGRIAILHASPEPYGRLVHELLSAAGIAANGAAVVPLAERTAGRVLLRLLDWPAGGYQRWDLFAWLAASPLRHDGRPVQVGNWERLSRQAAVVAGRSDWDRLLRELAHRLEEEAGVVGADPEEPDWKAARLTADASAARNLRDFALGLIDELDTASTMTRTWPDHAGWARQLQTRLIGGPAQQQRWAPPEQKAAERVDAALDRLAAIGDVEGPVTLEVFARTLRLVLDSDLGRVGRLGEGVLVGSVGMGVGLDLDLVVVLGMAEGSFPAVMAEDALLGDTERAASDGQLRSRRGRVDQQHRELLAALAGARRHVISVPRGDLRRSAERVPSRWALDLASTIAGTRWWSSDLFDTTAAWVTHVASFDAGLRHSSRAATEQEYRLLCLVAGGWAAHDGEDQSDPLRLQAGEVVTARRSDRLTRFDGHLAGGLVASPVEGATSASRLEQWAKCPFGYLLRYVLNVDEVEDPEDALRMTALDKGELLHRAMEDFIGEVLARSEGQPPDPESPADSSRLGEIAGALCDDYETRGLTGRRIFWDRDRPAILRDLQAILADDCVHRQAGIRPVAAELAFGLGDAVTPAVPMALTDGRVVHFRGKADRVDLADDQTLYVTDYKSGSSRTFKGLKAAEPVLRGTKLQLPVYGQAARIHAGRADAPVRADYWFVSAREKFERVGYRVTDDILQQVGAVLQSIVEGIESGTFPHHPSTATATSPRVECPYCDPDKFGATELRRSLERKAGDPALRRYLALAEPDLVSEAADSDG